MVTNNMSKKETWKTEFKDFEYSVRSVNLAYKKLQIVIMCRHDTENKY